MQSFKKRERLYLKNEIQNLFDTGDSFFVYPFKVIWSENPVREQDTSPAKLLITVPKRKIKTAVKRNLLKRRTREAYRLNKKFFYEKIKQKKQTYHIAFIYLSGDMLDFAKIQTSIQKILHTLEQTINK